MQVRKIYKINMVFALLYFIIVLVATTLTRIAGITNPNNMALRIILCLFFSLLIMFISFENYNNGKKFFDKIIESKIIKTSIIFYYIFVCASIIFYIYESVAQCKANGAYIMSAATAIMLNVVNRSIQTVYDDSSEDV